MNRRDAAQVLAMCSWVRKQVSIIEDAAKVAADVTYADEKMAGVVDGTVVSYTSRVSRKPELEVLDETGFVAWVDEHYPTEIVSSVRPAFVTMLRDQALTTGFVIGPGGEVCDAVRLGDPTVYTQTRLVKDAEGVLAPKLSALTLADLPTYIEGGES